MPPATQHHRSALGLFRDQPAPRLYGRIIEVYRIKGVVGARRPKRLLVVLTVDEVSRVMSHLRGDKRLLAMLLNGGGLRLLEALLLRVKCI
jgi:integrase